MSGISGLSDIPSNNTPRWTTGATESNTMGAMSGVDQSSMAGVKTYDNKHLETGGHLRQDNLHSPKLEPGSMLRSVPTKPAPMLNPNFSLGADQRTGNATLTQSRDVVIEEKPLVDTAIVTDTTLEKEQQWAVAEVEKPEVEQMQSFSTTVGEQELASTSGWHHEITTSTTTATTVPHLSAPAPLLMDHDLTRNYMPTRDSAMLQQLIDRLNQLSLQIDQYAKAQQDMVSKEAVGYINQVMLESKLRHDDLAKAVRQRTYELDCEFQQRRERLLAELDKTKAERFALLEGEFQKLQETINVDSRRQMDEIVQKAKMAKLQIVQEAQQKQDMLTHQVSTTTIGSLDTTIKPVHLDLHPTITNVAEKIENLSLVREERTTLASEPRTQTTTHSLSTTVDDEPRVVHIHRM